MFHLEREREREERKEKKKVSERKDEILNIYCPLPHFLPNRFYIFQFIHLLSIGLCILLLNFQWLGNNKEEGLVKLII